MRTSLNRRNRTACSILALATALAVGPSPAAAQVAGSGTFAVGTGTINAGAGTVTLDNSRSVINWNSTGTVTNGVNQFLAPGNTLSFNGTGNFAVLNRVSTGTDMLGLNGTVNGGQGSIYFYNPNGIVVGGSSIFNVGSLVLTTLDITDNNFASGSSTITFNQAANALSSVTVSPLAQINAGGSQSGSYVALVAPKVVHNGVINVDGSAALVAAEAATITFSPDGLFDITVDSGTTDANGVGIGGTITGPQAGVGEFQRIYAVAVPKNQALTMAITAGANLGFNVAGAADVDGNAIVLSAGHNIVAGEIDPALAPAGGTGEAHISAQNFTATSALTMVAKTDATIGASTSRTLHSDVTVKAGRAAAIVAGGANTTLTIKGDVEVNADKNVAAGTSGTAGSAAFYAHTGGTLTAEGNVTMSADAYGLDSSTTGVAGGNATGGTIFFQGQSGGHVNVFGGASLSANGEGGDALASGVNAGTGRGGTIQVQAYDSGSSLTVGSYVFASADGYGGYAGCVDCNGLGGAGNGGTVNVGPASGADNSAVTLGNFETFLSFSAGGYGGASSGGTAGATGTGGTVFVQSMGVNSTLDLRGDVDLSAFGFGGDAAGSGVNGGLGDGGSVYVQAGDDGAAVIVRGTTDIFAEGYGGGGGGEGCSECLGAGGTGFGGEVQLYTGAGAPGASLTFEGEVNAYANGYGGYGVGAGGLGDGGLVSSTFAAGTSIDYQSSLSFDAIGYGGDSGDSAGGTGLGGRVTIGSQTGATGGSLTVAGNTTANVAGLGGHSFSASTGGTGQGGTIDAGGSAGTINFGNFFGNAHGTGGLSDTGTGGTGRGGTGFVDAFGATVTIGGNYAMDAGATGGEGATGGNALGGGAVGNPGGAQLVSTSSLSVAGTAVVAANATGGYGNNGNGGAATGGFASIRAEGVGNNLTVNGNVNVEARANGGQATALGGNAQGGFAQIAAFVGGSIDLLGLTRVSSDATAFNSGDGRGGTSRVFAGNASSIDLNQLNLRADGRGGDDTGLEAGDGYGGTATLEANGPNASVTVANNITTGPNLQDREMLSADGFGGTTNGNGDPEGGDGTGGTVNMRATAGGTVSLATNATGTDNILIRARGYGGNADADNTVAGEAFGGTLNLVVDGGTMTTGFLQYSAIGQGGTATSAAITAGYNITGGEGFGGTRNISVVNGTLTTAIVGGVAGGVGGDGIGTGNGGNASGGTASLTVTNSTLNSIGNIGITTQVFAGSAAGSGNGGNATGPNTVNVNITNSTINMASGSTLGITGNAFAGGSQSGNGGNAFGGTTTVNITGSSILGGTVTAGAGASGGSSVGGNGGSGTAGTAAVNLNGATINGAAFTIGSNGFGGSGANGGHGTGGTAVLNSFGAASSLTTTDLISIQASGLGASSTGSGNGGNGAAAGAAQIFASGATTLTLNGNVEMNAIGSGGAGGANGGNGGNADGGMAEIYANDATININGNASLAANAVGGNSSVGTGGNAFGGTARIGTDEGLVAISGALSLNGSALGGNGTIGGNATAIVSTIDEETAVAASIYAGNNGAVTVGGATAINASATGGNGSNGNGGNATAGETDIVAYIGDITLAALTLNANGTGGNGGLGGNGGIGNGGFADVAFGLGSAPVDGTITMTDASISANGIGGAGGAGTDANTGGNGGAGGAGNGGGITFAGSAAGGSLQGGDITLSATATGGVGGAGGNGDSGSGGNGGAGGAAIGGFIQSGTISAQNSLGSGGDFDVGNLAINTSAFGGNGGNGGTGGAGNGAGGNGGNAEGGRSDFLIRGVAGSADAVTLVASATGGNGGSGSTVGNGGNATTGLLGAEAKDRFGHPTQRGSLVADSITATAIATGGSGAIAGTETVFGGSFFRVLNGDANIGSVNFTIDGNIYDTTFGSDNVSVRDGTAIIGSFSYTTTGGLTLDASNGSMDATSIALNAATFLASNPTTLPAPTVVGTYSADSFSITTGGNFITNANLDSVNALSIIAPGEIIAANIVGASNVTLGAGGLVVAGNVTAGGSLTAQTIGAMSLGNLVSGTDLLAQSTGALSVGAVTAGGSADLNSGTSLVAGNVTAGADIHSRVSGASSFGALSAGTDVNLGATGALSFVSATADETVRIGSDATVTGGAVTAGDSIVGTSQGNLQLGALSAGLVNPSTANGALYEVALVTGGALNVASINAAGDVQLAAVGGIVAGNVTTAARMFALADSAITLGDLSIGGYTLIGSNMFEFTGTLSVDSTFDARPTFDNFGDGTGKGAGGNVTLGSVTVGSLDAATTGTFQSLAITAAGDVRILAIGAATTGNITSTGGDLQLEAGGNLQFGNVDAGEVNFEAGGSVQGGNILADSNIDGEAQGAIVLGSLTVTGAPTEDNFSVGLQSATSIQVGNIIATNNVGFATLGNLTTGTITAGDLIMALVGGDIVTGALTTASSGQVYIADSSMFATGGGPGDFDENIVLALDPVATGGSLAINGAIDTPLFRAAIGDAFAIGDISVEGGFAVEASSITTGDITATAFIDLTATGAIVTGDLFAGTSVSLDGASVMTGNIVAGMGEPVVLQGFTTMDVGPGNSVEIFSDSSIVTGNITTDGYVGLYAPDNITAGAITAGHDVIALAGGDASFGPITTPERFILAGYGNFDQLNDGETFDPELVFSLFPIESTSGNASFAGSSNVGSFEAYVGGNTTIQSLTADAEFGSFINIDTGGLLSINGLVAGDFIRLLSSDIAVGQTAQVNATDHLSFVSISPGGTFIGDNLSGQGGYRLTQAELDRTTANSYSFAVYTDRGGAPLMLLGDLAFNFPASSNGEDDDEVLEFSVVSDSDEENDGIIRIVGNVDIRLGADQAIEFESETFEIDAATGSLSLLDSDGALSGILAIEAQNIFVASGEILAKLEQNPQYAGFREELNAPAAVQRPEGVIRAAVIDLAEDDDVPANVLVQNTGTSAKPAGFLVNELTFDLDDDDNGDGPPPAGSINMVINGQIQTGTGTLTGSAVRDAFVQEFGTEIFVAGSTINGCPLSGGSCGQTTTTAPPPSVVVTPTQVAILTSDPLGESVFGNEGDIAGDSGDGEGGDDGSASSPIDAPQPLFDTRPLNSDEDINEPVSGAGNPSLYGISSDEDDDDDEDDEEEKKRKKKKGEVQPASQPNARTGDGQ